MKKVDKKKARRTLSANEYRKEARKHLDSLKTTWGLFGKTGVFVLASAIVLVVICAAWFASNREVQGRDMMVTAAGSTYELAVIGGEGEWDRLVGEAIARGEEQEIDGKTYWTTGKDSTILWALNGDSNLENQKEVGRGLEPGTRGSLTFYILAKRTEPLTVNFSLQLIGQLEDGKDIPTDATDLLSGHILLFAGYDSANYSYLGWISEDAETWRMELDVTTTLQREEDGTLTWTGEVEEGKVYPITIYWIWPDSLGQYLFRNQGRIGKNPILFPNDQAEGIDSISALPEGLFEKMCQTPDGAVSNRYLKWARESDPVSEKQSLKEEFSELVTAESLLNIRKETGYNLAFYGKLCNYYNRADQYIGEEVEYLKLKLETN